MPCLRFSFLFCVGSLFSVSWAQEPLSFNQCVDLVRKNNADVRAADETLQASRYQVDSYRGAYFPQLTGNLGYLQSGPTAAAGTVLGSTYSATLNATQNLFNGFSDVAKVETAQAQTRVSDMSLQVTKAKASYDLKVAFASLLYAKESEKVTKDFQKRREENLRMVELRFQNGRENKGSLLLSQAYLKQSRSDVLKARHSSETSQSDLKKVIGFDADQALDIMDELPLREPSSVDPDYRDLAINNPARLQSLAQVDVSQASLTSAKAGFFPILNLTGSVGKSADHFFPDTDRWSVGANLSWPLFGGGKDYYATQSAAANLYSSKNNLTSVERQLYSTLKKAYTAYLEAVEDLKVNDAFLVAAKSRAEIARSKYNNGLLTFDEWDIIENDLINRTKVYLQSKRDRIIAEAAWEQAQGTGVIP